MNEDIKVAQEIIKEKLEELDLKKSLIDEGINLSDEDFGKAVFAALAETFGTYD